MAKVDGDYRASNGEHRAARTTCDKIYVLCENPAVKAAVKQVYEKPSSRKNNRR